MKFATLAQVFKDYLFAAAVLGTMVLAAVTLGMRLETALYAAPFAAVAVVGVQYWWRRHWPASSTSGNRSTKEC